MSDHAAHIFTIPPGVSFVDALAAGLLAETGGDPLALSRYTVLLPTRRARRALDEAFLRQADGRPLLLPRSLPLGDLDPDEIAFGGADEAGAADASDLPPPIPALRRQLLLTQAIQAASRASGTAMTVDQAARLAAELAGFLDQVQTEQISFDRLRNLVPEDYAGHWQLTLRFLSVLTEQWPSILAAEGCLDPAERRNRVLAAQAESWRRHPPADPVIAAGSTGSIPATAELLATIAALPTGRLVLPGLDRAVDEATRAAILDDPGHPQHGLCRLLARLGVESAAVADWPTTLPSPTLPARARLLAEALRPAATTDSWRGLAQQVQRDASLVQEFSAALQGVTRVDCAGPQEEAGVIALLLREALETPGRRAALVTPDRGLARRVTAELARWSIAIDDSAGQALGDTPPGTFLRLTAELFVDDVAPVPLLAVLKHPLAAGGRNPAAFRSLARRLDERVLRGARPAPGFAGLRCAVPADRDLQAVAALVDELGALATPLAALIGVRPVSLVDLVDAHLAFAEALARSDSESGAARLWAGDAGEAAATFIATLRQAAAGFAPLQGDRYPALLTSLLAAQVVRPRYGRHPRVAIWGPLEARLQQANLLILGGLNEGTWPAEPPADPWLSRPMRRDFGLPAPERRIGLAAHDFAQALGARDVVLTRSLRVEGTPTVPSRWLLRLDGLLGAIGLDPARLQGDQWLWLQQQLDHPLEVRTIAPPEPRPPLDLRPRKISVTQVETWRRDPYAIYARHILRLKPLDGVDEEPGAADRGDWIHHALEHFVRACPEVLPADALDRLLDLGRQQFGRELSRPTVGAFWWPRFERIARWFIAQERERRRLLTTLHVEVRGTLEIPGAFAPFMLTATADRIERRTDGSLAVVDYKTGGIPTGKDIEFGFVPQLPLEGAIAEAGGFAGIAAAPVSALEFWRLTGGNPAAEVKDVKGDPADLAATALAGLKQLVAAFDRPETAYHAVPDPEVAPRFSDYAHLARVQEWSAVGRDDIE